MVLPSAVGSTTIHLSNSTLACAPVVAARSMHQFPFSISARRSRTLFVPLSLSRNEAHARKEFFHPRTVDGPLHRKINKCGKYVHGGRKKLKRDENLAQQLCFRMRVTIPHPSRIFLPLLTRSISLSFPPPPRVPSVWC